MLELFGIGEVLFCREFISFSHFRRPICVYHLSQHFLVV